jgi:hypothetical protein
MGNTIATVELATVLPGSRRLGEHERGVEDSYVGLVQLGDDQLRAYIKVLPGRQICNELLGAVVARAVGLPVPRPFLAHASMEVLPESPLLKAHGGPALVFASEALPHPDLSRRFRSDEAQLADWMLANWKGWEETLVYDEWLANVDRNPDLPFSQELDREARIAIKGASANTRRESQVFEALSKAVQTVMDGIASALAQAARMG